MFRLFSLLRGGFGRGGNILILLAVFLAVGLVLHYQDRWPSETSFIKKFEQVFSGNFSIFRGSPEYDVASDFGGSVKGQTIEEILDRKDFVWPLSSGDRLQLVEHSGFTLGYNERYEQAAWVAYPLLREQVIGPSARERFYNPDPKVETGSALFSDYSGSGYDRGHLAPAADFKHDPEQMKETFYMSNISPQDREFNSGIWNDIEKIVRAWANRYERIFVVSGPVLSPDLDAIGRVNRVAVPEYFYKVVLYAKPPNFKGIAFLVKNEPSMMQIAEATVSIDSVEALTGLDFFPLLPDDIESKTEKTINRNDWYRLKQWERR